MTTPMIYIESDLPEAATTLREWGEGRVQPRRHWVGRVAAAWHSRHPL